MNPGNSQSSDSGIGSSIGSGLSQSPINSSHHGRLSPFSLRPQRPMVQQGVPLQGQTRQSMDPVLFSFRSPEFYGAVPPPRLTSTFSNARNVFSTSSSHSRQSQRGQQRAGQAGMKHPPSFSDFHIPGVTIYQNGPVQNFTFAGPGSYDINLPGQPVRTGGEASDPFGTTRIYETQLRGLNEEEPMDVVEMRTTLMGIIPPSPSNSPVSKF